jgi:hypothetical protein
MIRISDEAKRLLATLWSPDRDVLRLVLRSPEADGARELAFGHGRGRAQTR